MNFDDLVIQSESLVKNLDEDSLPHVHKSIEHLLQQKDKLICSRVPQNDIKAAKLLGNKVGNELSTKLSKTLESLEVMSTPDRGSTISTDDIPSFLKQQRENAILFAFSLAKNRSNKESFKKIDQAKSNWWKIEKNKIYNVLVNSDKLSHLIQNTQRKVKISYPENERYHLNGFNKDELEYLREVKNYVDMIINPDANLYVPIENILLPMKNNKNSDIKEIYSLTLEFTKISENYSSRPLLENRQNDCTMCKEFIVASIKHLEVEFSNYIKQCMTVGVLSDYTKDDLRRNIGLYVQSLLIKEEMSDFDDGSVDGVPIWPYLYTCLRAGLYDITLDLLKESSGNIGDMYNVMSQLIYEGCVPSDIAKKMSSEYKRSVKMSGDICKRLIYCLIAGCDIDDNHTRVLSSIDDFMWVRLWHARRFICSRQSGAAMATGDVFHSSFSKSFNSTRYSTTNSDTNNASLSHLQKLILEEYGESYFQASDNPLAYCRILLLCQLFENAVAFLARFDGLLCHAVHLAVVLWNRNVLLVPNDIRAAILSREDGDPHGIVRLNVARIITLYTGKFELEHPSEALDLFYLLRDMSTVKLQDDEDENGSMPLSKNESVFVTLVSELAISAGSDCRILESVFGENGILTRRLYGYSWTAVLERIASRLAAQGSIEAACDALELCKKVDKAAETLCRGLASAAISGGNEFELERLKIRARTLLARCTSGSHEPLLPSLDLLERVEAAASFLSADVHITSESSASLLSLLDMTRLLPSNSEELAARTQAFSECPGVLRGLLAPLLLQAARVLRMQLSHVLSGSYGQQYYPQQSVHQHQNSLLVAELRSRAAALVVFTGQLSYRLPAEVYSSLSQLEISLN